MEKGYVRNNFRNCERNDRNGVWKKEMDRKLGEIESEKMELNKKIEKIGKERKTREVNLEKLP